MGSIVTKILAFHTWDTRPISDKIVAPATQKPFDTSQPACIGSGENISEASKLLHLPHKTHAYGDKLVCRVICDQNVGRVTEGVLVWPGPRNGHLRPYRRGR